MLSDYILYLHPCPLNCDEYNRLNETKCHNLSSLFNNKLWGQSKTNHMECNCENTCV